MVTREMFNAYAALRYPSDLVSRTEDFVITGPAGKIPVRLYVPHTIMLSSAKGIRGDLLPIAAPVLVYYHGGGFVAGDLESHDSLLRALANRSQCIVISWRTVLLRKILTPLRTMMLGPLLYGSLITRPTLVQTPSGSRLEVIAQVVSWQHG